jgi:hypothetical protein
MKAVLPVRVVFAAAALSERCQNPNVAAMNRMNRAKSERSRAFWMSVIQAFVPAYVRCMSDYDIACKRQISAMRQRIKGAA